MSEEPIPGTPQPRSAQDGCPEGQPSRDLKAEDHSNSWRVMTSRGEDLGAGDTSPSFQESFAAFLDDR